MAHIGREVVVLGVGMHPFGKFVKSNDELSRYAVDLALKDAGVAWPEVQAIVAGNSPLTGGWAGNEVEYMFGLTGVPVFNVQAACATGGNAYTLAHLLVSSGQCDVVLVVGAEKMPKGFIARHAEPGNDTTDRDYMRWACVGIPNPGYWALACCRRMHERGTTEKHLAMVSAKAHKIAVHNPNARYRKELTVDEILASPMVCYPLRLYEICAVSDGAAAAILCSAEFARRKTTRPVWSAAAAFATSQFGDCQIRIPELSTTSADSAPYISEVAIAVRKALEMAGVEPGDIDLLELQDNCSWQELEYPELWGFCGEGESEWLLERGETGVNGKLPINPSGGFLSFGEATTVMGLYQVHEMTQQLRKQAGSRQVESAQVALGQTLGMWGNGAAIVLKA